MAEAPAVTFVIPTLNRRQLIVDCLASIAAQSEGGWRVVVVDDASSDDTEGAVRALSMPALEYLRNDVPLGAADSRNRGVTEADTEVVAFIDSDDRLHEGYLARLRTVLREHPQAGVVSCDSRVVDAEGRELHGGVSFQTMEARRKRYHLASGFRSFEDIFVFSTTLPGTAARRDAFLAAGGFSQRAFPMEDVVFQLHAAARGIPVYYLHEVLADYRAHPGSASAGPGRAVLTCAKKVEVLAACAPLAPAGTRRWALRRRQADVQLELAIALWWAGSPARAAVESLRSLAFDPTVLPRVLFDRVRRPPRVEVRPP